MSAIFLFIFSPPALANSLIEGNFLFLPGPSEDSDANIIRVHVDGATSEVADDSVKESSEDDVDAASEVDIDVEASLSSTS